MKKFIGNGDPASKEGFALPPSDHVDVAVLTGTNQEFNVPAGASYVVFSSDAPFFAAYGATPAAAVPGASVTDGSGSEQNPTVKRLDGVGVISLAGTATVTLSYYG
jgi:hypothetical protein